MEELSNVRVRRSSDYIDGSYTDGLHGSTIVFEDKIEDIKKDKNVFVCTAPSRKGKCGNCRVCFSKFPVVAYVAHGHSIKRVRKESFSV